MNQEKIRFKNRDGLELSARLELPADSHPHNYALFAHCFTCSKNLAAARNISHALVSEGFGVLRIDFTGLGESEGDFSETNFSGNVEDLVDAGRYLAANYKAPALLVGHSLGGAAVIFASEEIESVKAVATIGAPSEPTHLRHLVSSSLEKISHEGKAVVQLGGRDFTIKKQFLEDLERNKLGETAERLRKALLIMHSPQDDTVGIRHAESLYRYAHHPKSFISLDGADHLLTNSDDSSYAGQVIGSWARRYISLPTVSKLESSHQVVASLAANDGYTTRIKAGSHYMTADEPVSFGGNDFGPSPYGMVSAGLAACTAMTLHMYARRKNWPLEEVRVHTSHGKEHAEDCADCESGKAKIDSFQRIIEISGPLDNSQKERLLEIANKCPVHRTLHSEVRIPTKLA